MVTTMTSELTHNDEELNQMIQSALEDYEAGEFASYTAQELREMANI